MGAIQEDYPLESGGILYGEFYNVRQWMARTGQIDLKGTKR
jgi:hypothetical protein